MGTTTNGIVYPDASSVPSRSALQTLATSTDAILTGTGWVTMTNAGTSGTARYRVVAGIVFVQLSSVVISIASGTSVSVVLAGNGIPAAYCPSAVVYSGAYSASIVGYIQVNPDGSIEAHASTAAMANCSGIVVYPVG